MDILKREEIIPGVLNPRQSANWIVEHTDPDREIRIVPCDVERVAQMICNSSMDQLKQLEFSLCEIHPKTIDQAAVDWIFLIDSINFSFWGIGNLHDDANKDYAEIANTSTTDNQENLIDKDIQNNNVYNCASVLNSSNNCHYKVTYGGQTYSGYFAGCAAVNRALKYGIQLTNAECMTQIDEQKLDEIFCGDNGSTIPMLKERVEVIKNNGQILLKKFHGLFYNCLLECNRSAYKLLQLIVEHFPNFRDFAEYNGIKVSFLKRAQILVADLYNCLHGIDPAADFFDINELTMFADYRIPQALAYLGVLQYSPSVLTALRSGNLLANGSRLEVQLRGHSIAACDQILEQIKAICTSSEFSGLTNLAIINRLRLFTAVDVDVWLWLWRREHAEQIEAADVPFH